MGRCKNKRVHSDLCNNLLYFLLSVSYMFIRGCQRLHVIRDILVASGTCEPRITPQVVTKQAGYIFF